MSYSAKTDILEQLDEDILIQLTDDADAGSVDDDAVTRAIANADAVIDGYCGTRYDVPFSTTPDIVRMWSVDIAIYNLYGRRRGAPDDVAKRNGDAIAALKDVANGKFTLAGTTPASDSDFGPEATTSKDDRIFTTGRDSDGTTGSLDNY